MAKPPQSAADTPPDASRCESRRKIADSLGGGEVRLYHLKKHVLPDVVNTPREQQLAECEWWMVHFPSRTCVAVPEGRSEGLRLLKKLEQGKDELGWIPLPKVKKARAGARSRVGVCVTAEEPLAEKEGKGEDKPKVKKMEFTPVPPEMGFDAAMKHVFPNARITQEIEKLLVAEDPIFDKEGNEVGCKPAHMVRKEAVKLMIEHAQGRAGEKPPPPPDKKKVSYDELEKQILSSKATRMVLKRLIESADAAEAAQAVPAPAVSTQESKA
jgi:hypothetical protein